MDIGAGFSRGKVERRGAKEERRIVSVLPEKKEDFFSETTTNVL
jgi:hypothetical protein